MRNKCVYSANRDDVEGRNISRFYTSENRTHLKIQRDLHEYYGNNINQESTADHNSRMIGVCGFYRSNTGTAGSNPTKGGGHIYICVLYVEGGLSTGRLPVQGILPNI
jgi:hypothetical protein